MEFYKINIQQRKQFRSCSVQFNNTPIINKIIIQSIVDLDLIPGVSTNTIDSIMFNCNSIQSLDYFMYDMIESKKQYSLFNSSTRRFIYNITKQLKYIIDKYKHTIVCFNPKHIWVINKTNFVYFSGEFCFPIHTHVNLNGTDSSFVEIMSPISSIENILSPELKSIQNLPRRIHYKCSFYSIGVIILIINDMFIKQAMYHEIKLDNDKNDNNNDIVDKTQILLENCKDDWKIHSFIRRAINIDPTKRFLFFI